MNGHSRWSRSKNSPVPKRRSGSSRESKKSTRKPLPRPHETEEEAIIRRFHDAQRMARFRAKRKKALEEAKALEASKLAEIAVISELRRRNVVLQLANPVIPVLSNPTPYQPVTIETPQASAPSASSQSKYSQLLAVIEELGKDIRLTYAGSRTSADRLKMGIVQARILVRDCLLETEVNSR